ncbi:MAG: PDZ domain-containing protein [Planctomycetaceae bacterium]|nr:PDZ domain-containing protein [Planctomycetaceae bacterium]
MRSWHWLTTLSMVFVAASLPAQDDLEGLEEQAIRSAVAAVAPSVVRIETIGGLERVGQVLVGTGPTSGLVVSDDGFIVSSAFNFIQQPTSILVTLPGGQRTTARIVARDHARMIVLLKVNSESKLPVPVAVPRSEVSVGQWSIAVGRTYDQPEPNLSVGVISATNRVWGKAIQTDAKISPSNYGGPLIDIHGRVLGVLVPLSPQTRPQESGAGEIAGAEWYNSGIGFAVPLAEINERLAALKAGKDLHAGLLGISFKPGDIYSLPAEIAAAQPGSPAYKAGVKAGDTIVEIDGHKIVRQAQLRQVLGTRYAGDKVHLVLKRGDASIEATAELVEKLDPYQHPFLGILPLRATTEPGVAVRYVYPGSPAAEAGIQPADRIVALTPAGSAEVAVADATALRTAVANLEPKTKVSLKVMRGDQTLAFELLPAKLPTEIPGELPPALAQAPADPAEKPATGVIEIKLPEEASQCLALVPDNYHPQVSHGLVVVLHAPGEIDKAAFEARWKPICQTHRLIALAPMSAKSDKWEPTEADFIRKTIDDCVTHHNIDPTRIVAYGYQAGGSMAWLVAFNHLDRVRAVIAIDALPPARAKTPENDPVNRLAIFLGTADKSTTAAATKALVARLESARFPISQKALGDQPRELTAEELAELGRWIDALDRI